jgi:glycosyltransferase involved in cell wall biosynthesis
MLFDVHPFLRWLNSIFIRRMAGVIISGPSHNAIFESMIDNSRIHVIPNFAQDPLFVNEPLLDKKFSDLSILRLLYISGMTAGKGYLHLLEAYQNLDDDIKKIVHIDFAGKFSDESERIEFIRRIGGVTGITYHGLVDDAMKQSLFANAHIFCLPTTYLEGQPISILEAYASGCVVVTTGQDGIRDVFTDGVNGYEIKPHDINSIELTIKKILSSSVELIGMARNNRHTAITQYRTEVFTKRVEKLLLSSSKDRALS